ncbi:unnamed protein product [Plutella xylostella]|uniref:(diamondback moth) hypothetical protein n=1 Tax=Plutella xylostella TaxID=51655 RepID=A0A8S4DJK9_PLUXY|nr:unnamed protein product [Plutella xylostella]
METAKLLILLCCTSYSIASHLHNIPVEGYETKLQDLGQHVEIPETPVKIIKVTKTIAVKVPVPYPVRVVQKVPYPVHVNRPYPVPVPHIIRVPHDTPVGAHDGAAGAHAAAIDPHASLHGVGYGVQEDKSAEQPSPYGHGAAAPAPSYYDHSSESKSYDDAVGEYLRTHQLGSHGGDHQHYFH